MQKLLKEQPQETSPLLAAEPAARGHPIVLPGARSSSLLSSGGFLPMDLLHQPLGLPFGLSVLKPTPSG